MATKFISELSPHTGIVAANDALVIHDESSSETHKIYISCLISTVFRPEQFGAAGDGITDDTDAMQDALDAAAVSGGIVVLSKASYLISSSLLPASNITITGIGNSSVIISGTADLHIINTTSTAPSNIVIDNFKIVAAGDISSNNASCIVMRNATNFKITRMYLSNTYEDGVYVYNSTCGLIEDIYCDDTRRQGIAVVDGSDITIRHIRGEGTMGHLVDIEPNTGETVTYLSISDVHLYSATIPALAISGTDVDSISEVSLDDIVSTTLGVEYTKNLNASNMILHGRTDIDTFTVYRVNHSNFMNIQCLGIASDGNEKLYVSDCEECSFSNFDLHTQNGGLVLDLLGNDECKFSNFTINGSPSIAVRLRDSNGTIISGISVDNVDSCDQVFYLAPTTASTRTRISGISLKQSSTPATVAVYLAGDAGDIYLDGDISASTTKISKASTFTGTVQYGSLIGVTRKIIPATANPSSLAERGDWWWNTAPSAGGSPGSVCVQRLDTTVKTTVSSGISLDVNTDTSGLAAGDVIGIALDSGSLKWTSISSIFDSDTVVLSSAFTSQAASGNDVYTMRWKAMANMSA